VKIRGQRIELAEIEALARRTGLVRRVAADASPEALTVYVELRPDDQTEFECQFTAWLPPFLSPRVVCVHELPLTASGKVDMVSLRSQNAAVAATARSAGPTMASDLWSIVLGSWAAGLSCADFPHDTDFLSLGGDSLGVMKVIARVSTTTGIRVSPRDVLGACDVNSFHELIARRTRQPA
jgi:acyl carrier protein